MKKILGSALVVGALLSGNASALVIDDFNNPAFSINAVNQTTTTASSTDTETGIIGGERETSAALISGGNPAFAGNSGIDSGGFTHNTNDGVLMNSSILWDGAGMAGLGGVDLTDSGASNGFVFDIVSMDQGSVDVVLTVIDASALSSTRTVSNLGVSSNTVLFSTFAGIADFTDVHSIQMDIIQNNTGTDLKFDLLETNDVPNVSGVPVPGAVWLFGTGLLGLMGTARRKKA